MSQFFSILKYVLEHGIWGALSLKCPEILCFFFIEYIVKRGDFGQRVNFEQRLLYTKQGL